VSCNRSAVGYLKKTTERKFFKSLANFCASVHGAVRYTTHLSPYLHIR
jgi:hypothetical protein